MIEADCQVLMSGTGLCSPANRIRAEPLIFIHGIRGAEASISILDGALLAGKIPAGKLRLVQAWIEIHRDDLIADWEIAISGGELFKIEPLR
jgi:hypothetical protein